MCRESQYPKWYTDHTATYRGVNELIAKTPYVLSASRANSYCKQHVLPNLRRSGHFLFVFLHSNDPFLRHLLLFRYSEMPLYVERPWLSGLVGMLYGVGSILRRLEGLKKPSITCHLLVNIQYTIGKIS